MAEARSIARSDQLVTQSTLSHDLEAIGVEPGMTLLVHTAMSKIGWIAGGGHAVIEALIKAVGSSGTIMMPTQTGQLSDPAEWSRPPVPESWWDRIRTETPAFDPDKTPSRQMGAINELFRSWPGALRSHHPHASFAAVGRHADLLTRTHRLEEQLGEQSPLGTLYDLDGHVLFLGPGYGNCTAFHLAEYRQPNPPMKKFGAAVIEDGAQSWKQYQDVDIDDSDFPDIGAAFDETGAPNIRKIGAAECRLFSVRAAVDFSTSWIPEHRKKISKAP